MVLVWPTDADQLLSSICPNGGSIAFTDFPLTIPDLNRVRDCGSMQASVSILPVLEGEAMCDLYQRYAGYCGCDRCGGKQLSFVWQREFRSLCPWERAAHL